MISRRDIYTVELDATGTAYDGSDGTSPGELDEEFGASKTISGSISELTARGGNTFMDTGDETGIWFNHPFVPPAEMFAH